jgi:putative mycofactocin binding protein MftB
VAVTLEGAFALNAQVALRPEPFGALAYHYGNRRLVFLRSHDMVTVVESLADSDDVASALTKAGVAERRWPAVLNALNALEESEVICAR